MVAEMAAMFGDATGLIKYTSPSKAFHWRLRFEILRHIKNSEDGFHQGTPLPLLTQWGYVCVYVYVRGLSFGYRENLFFFFELFKFDKSRYFPESYSNSEKKIVLLWEVSMRLWLRTRVKLMLANFSFKKNGPFWDLKTDILIFVANKRLIGENNLQHVSYLPKSCIWKKE